jgi:transposase
MPEHPASLSPCAVGIDVSKDTLDICLYTPEAKKPYRSWKEKNEAAGFQRLCQVLKEQNLSLIVLEPSGGYEILVWQALIQSGLPVRRESALKVYYYGRSQGQLGKTDKMDARKIADYAFQYASRLSTDTLLETEREQLKILVQRREQLVRHKTQENNRLQHPFIGPMMQSSLESSLTRLKQQLLWLDKDIQALLDKSPSLNRIFERLTAVPGVGRITALKLLVYLPELGCDNRRQIPSLAGLVPHPRESGQWKGQRQISGGRVEVRCALYMATLTAIRKNPRIQPFYEHLVQRGKPKKVAIIACARKLLKILNAMVAQDEDFKQAD